MRRFDNPFARVVVSPSTFRRDDDALTPEQKMALEFRDRFVPKIIRPGGPTATEFRQEFADYMRLMENPIAYIFNYNYRRGVPDKSNPSLNQL